LFGLVVAVFQIVIDRSSFGIKLEPCSQRRDGIICLVQPPILLSEQRVIECAGFNADGLFKVKDGVLVICGLFIQNPQNPVGGLIPGVTLDGLLQVLFRQAEIVRVSGAVVG
jgi:hypothetical protein